MRIQTALEKIFPNAVSEKIKALNDAGFHIGLRDPNLNRAFKGYYMVSEDYKIGIVTDDASNGPLCIVGDDAVVLVHQAYQEWIPPSGSE